MYSGRWVTTFQLLSELFYRNGFIEDRITSYAKMHVEKNHRPSQFERRCFNCRSFIVQKDILRVPNELTADGYGLRKVLSQVEAEEKDETQAGRYRRANLYGVLYHRCKRNKTLESLGLVHSSTCEHEYKEASWKLGLSP